MEVEQETLPLLSQDLNMQLPCLQEHSWCLLKNYLKCSRH